MLWLFGIVYNLISKRIVSLKCLSAGRKLVVILHRMSECAKRMNEHSEMKRYKFPCVKNLVPAYRDASCVCACEQKLIYFDRKMESWQNFQSVHGKSCIVGLVTQPLMAHNQVLGLAKVHLQGSYLFASFCAIRL